MGSLSAFISYINRHRVGKWLTGKEKYLPAFCEIPVIAYICSITVVDYGRRYRDK
jgi:hypothetical protein